MNNPERETTADDGLADFGYRQSLKRTIGKFASFAAGVSYISILTGTFQLFYFGFGTGGPAYLWSWPMVFVGQLAVALCFAELAARHPVAGSVYNWCKRLANPTISWLAGWMMFTASVVTLAGVVLAYQVTLPQLWSGFQLIGDGSGSHDFAISAVIWGALLILFTTLVNAFGVKLMARINSIGVIIELAAAILLVVILGVHIVRGPDVFFDTHSLGEGKPGGYAGVFLIASIASAYVMYGFDTASSLGEETVDPRRTAPTAILRSVFASFLIGGLILVFAVLAAPDLTDSRYGTSAGGLQLIVLQVLGGPMGKVFLGCIVVAITVCALAVHTAGIRLMFAMARDNALPAGRRLAKINAKTGTPVVAAIFLGAVAVLILFVNIGTPQIFTAVTSVAVIMIYLAYLLVTVPLLVKRLRGEWSASDRGYFSLGRWGLLVNIVAVLWGAATAVNLAWPRAEVYGDGPLRWVAFLFIGFVSAVGLLWFRSKGRHRLGTLAEHRNDAPGISESEDVAAKTA